MIHFVEPEKCFVLYCRTNRRVKWLYSEYGGRYETLEKAIDAAKEHYKGQSFEYLIQDMVSGKVYEQCVNM